MQDQNEIGTPVEGWVVYRKLILAELERLTREVTLCNTKLDTFRNDDMREVWKEITILKVKAGAAGFLAGLAGSLIVGVILYFITRSH